MFSVIKTIYKLLNDPLVKIIFRLALKAYLTVNKWIFTLVIGPVCFFSSKLMFKVAFKKILPGLVKKYFTKQIPKVILKLLKNTYPISFIIKIFE